MSDPGIMIHDLTIRRRGKTLLGPMTLTLPGTGFTIVLGPNGAGKTTLLKSMHGVERITSGTITWGTPEQGDQGQQAYVFQTPVMLRRSVEDNLAYPLQLQNLPRPEIRTRVLACAAQIGLEQVLTRPAPRLSGGERQKLALGRALIRKPKLLFLDEPCANLDGRATREIEALLIAAHQNGTRIIMTTHDLGQARRLATDVLFLLHGQAHEHTAAARFFTNPETKAAHAFLQGDIVE